MSKSKMHKYELGTHKTTEDNAERAMLNQTINEWVEKVREAGKIGDGEVRGSITRTAYVLLDLIRLTEQGRVPREVISGLVKKVDVQASLVEAQILRRSNANVSGKRC